MGWLVLASIVFYAAWNPWFVLLIALYCLCGYVGNAIAGRSEEVPLVWPPFGLALASHS